MTYVFLTVHTGILQEFKVCMCKGTLQRLCRKLHLFRRKQIRHELRITHWFRWSRNLLFINCIKCTQQLLILCGHLQEVKLCHNVFAETSNKHIKRFGKLSFNCLICLFAFLPYISCITLQFEKCKWYTFFYQLFSQPQEKNLLLE